MEGKEMAKGRNSKIVEEIDQSFLWMMLLVSLFGFLSSAGVGDQLILISVALVIAAGAMFVPFIPHQCDWPPAAVPSSGKSNSGSDNNPGASNQDPRTPNHLRPAA